VNQPNQLTNSDDSKLLNTLQILDLTFEDRDQVFYLINILEDNTIIDKTRFEDILKNILKKENYFYFKAVLDDQIIGLIGVTINSLLHHNQPVAEILELIVDPGYRSKKAGKQLLDFAEELAGKNQCELIELATNVKRTDAHRFYFKNGFIKSHFKLSKNLLYQTGEDIV
jgi:PhnO protein